MAQFNWAYVDGNVISGSGGPDGAVQYRTGTRTISGSSRFTFATSSNTLEVTGTVNISGTLNVAGTTTTISASNLVIRDPIIGLGFGSGSTLTGAVGDRGLIFGLAGNLNQAILWDQTSASFVVGKVGTQGPHGTAYNIPGGDFSAFKVGSLKFIDNISGSGGVTIEGESILKGALNVTGATTVKGDLSVTNASAISASGPMTIEGESILKGALNVTGAAAFANTITGSGTLTVGRVNTQLLSGSSLNINESKAVITTAGIISGSTISGALFVGGGSGLTDITSTWDGLRNGNASITGSLTVTTTITGSGILTAGQVTGSAVKSLGVLSGSNLNINESKTVISTAGHISSSGPMTIEGESILKGALNVTGAIESAGIITGNQVTGSNITALTSLISANIITGSGIITGNQVTGSNITALVGLISANTITGSGVLTAGQVNTQLLSGSNLSLFGGKALISTAGNLTAVSGTFSGDLICTGTLTLSGSDTTELLRLRKGTDQTREIVFENDGSDAASIYLNTGENFFITNTAVGNNISFKCGANQILSIVGNGTKVGINNTSPDSALDVSASLGSTTAAIIEGDVMISGSISAVPNASFILASQVFS